MSWEVYPREGALDAVVKTPFAAHLFCSRLDPHFKQKYQILTPTREICQKFEEFPAVKPKFGSDFSSL